jgi:hypothetical protein
MLVALLESAQDCYKRAADAHNRAVMTSDREYRLFLLKMERRWVRLAQHFAAGERIETFIIQRRSAE